MQVVGVTSSSTIAPVASRYQHVYLMSRSSNGVTYCRIGPGRLVLHIVPALKHLNFPHFFFLFRRDRTTFADRPLVSPSSPHFMNPLVLDAMSHALLDAMSECSQMLDAQSHFSLSIALLLYCIDLPSQNSYCRPSSPAAPTLIVSSVPSSAAIRCGGRYVAHSRPLSRSIPQRLTGCLIVCAYFYVHALC